MRGASSKRAARPAPCLCSVDPNATSLDAVAPAFAVESSGEVLRLRGRLEMPNAAAIWRQLNRVAGHRKQGRLAIDLSEVEVIDGAVMALVVALRSDLASRGVRTELSGASEAVRPLVELYEADAEPSRKRRDSSGRHTSTSEHPRHLGESTSGAGRSVAFCAARAPSIAARSRS